MKYISCDVETLGLSPATCSLIEIGMIVEDTKLKLPREQCPTFHCYINNEVLRGEPFAMAMNAEILKKIASLKPDDERFIQPDYVAYEMNEFIEKHFGKEKATFAGKNFAGFDLRFLLRLQGFSDIKRHHRTLDPGSMFVDFSTDLVVPDTKECKRRAGIAGDVLHTALDDSWDVIQLLRTRY